MYIILYVNHLLRGKVLIVGDEEKAVEFAENRGLLPKAKWCHKHKCAMRVYKQNNPIGEFRCIKSSCSTKKVSRACGTWFEDAKIPLDRMFYLMYCYARKYSYETVKIEDFSSNEKCLSQRTISDWYSYCRETVVIYLIETFDSKDKIGGLGKTVQIDESKFGRRKFNKGRRVDGHWVLGMIEDGSEDLRLEVCPENIRSAEALIPLIKKHVNPGTTIHTDYWKAYDCLSEHGFVHKKVNHSDPDNPFVAPDGTHTQRIESQWRVVKREFYNDNYSNNFTDWIYEYQWRRMIKKNRLDPFEELLKTVLHVYGDFNK